MICGKSFFCLGQGSSTPVVQYGSPVQFTDYPALTHGLNLAINDLPLSREITKLSWSF